MRRNYRVMNIQSFMMTSSNGNIFQDAGNLCGEFTFPRWIPRTKASDAEFVQAQIKENIQAPRHWPLWGEFAGDWWILRTNGQ